MASDPHNSGAPQDSDGETFPLPAKSLEYPRGKWEKVIVETEEARELTGGKVFKVVGKFETEKLTASKTYVVSFVIKIRDNASVGETTMKYELPGGASSSQQVDLNQQPREKRLTITMDNPFENPSPGMKGNITLSLYASGDDQMKGLVIMEFDITEKN